MKYGLVAVVMWCFLVTPGRSEAHTSPDKYLACKGSHVVRPKEYEITIYPDEATGIVTLRLGDHHPLVMPAVYVVDHVFASLEDGNLRARLILGRESLQFSFQRGETMVNGVCEVVRADIKKRQI